MRNAISFAGVIGAVCGNAGDDDIQPQPEAINNTDITSVVLNGWDNKVAAFVTRASRKKMKLKRLGSTITKDKHKRRVIKLMTTINAAGKLTSTIAMIKDRKFKKLKMWQVRLFDQGK